MEKFTQEDVVKALGNLSVLEVIALTKQLEQQWGVKAEPVFTESVKQSVVPEGEVQTEFNVVLASYPTDKKMGIIKLVRELTLMGLKEAKEFVEAAPKVIKESISRAEADELKRQLTEVGAVIEIK
jgi:large subunit ribosomal protein L7/L12